MTSFYRLSIVTTLFVHIASGLAAIFNATLVLASVVQVRRITVSYGSCSFR